MEFLGVFSCLLLTEAEKRILVFGGIGHGHVCESGSESLENLLLSLLDEEKLHMGTNLLVLPLIDSDEIAPFAGGVDAIVHNLAGAELGFLLKDLLWGSICIVDINMVHI